MSSHRQRVVRAHGRASNIVQHRAHLTYCYTRCCCGITERRYAAVPVDVYTEEWLKRKIRNDVHLTKGGCIGPCALANVARSRNHRRFPAEELPCVDLTLRISGFFRDAFPHLIDIFHEAVSLVVDLDEPLDKNFPRKHYLADLEAQIKSAALVIDTDNSSERLGGSLALAEALGARYLQLEGSELTNVAVFDLQRIPVVHQFSR